MDIIPVLDLMGGSVVRARMGLRGSYRPIETPLCVGSDPLDVARGLLRVARSDRLYVADLDAIERKGNHHLVLERLRSELNVELWVDAGIGDLLSARDWLTTDLGSLVLGSETQSDVSLVRSLAMHDHVVLSLDFRGSEFLGPSGLVSEPDAWPYRVIVMTLAQIGGSAGPDFARLGMIRALANRNQFYAAGGVRGAEDLLNLARLGAAGALVASCLHNGALGSGEIATLRSTSIHD